LVGIIVLVDVDEPDDVFELVIEPVVVDVLKIDQDKGDEADTEADELDVFDPRIVSVPVPLLEEVLEASLEFVTLGEDVLVFVDLAELVDVIDRAMVRVVVGLPVVVLVDVRESDDFGEEEDVFDIAVDRVEVLVDVAVFVDTYIGEGVNIEETCAVIVMKDDRVDVLEGTDVIVGAIAVSSRFLKDLPSTEQLGGVDPIKPIDNKTRTQRIPFL